MVTWSFAALLFSLNISHLTMDLKGDFFLSY